MFYRPIQSNLSNFNSAISGKLFDLYNTYISESNGKSVASKTIAPSGLRCIRKNWFRLRGTEMDSEFIDTALQYRAETGTARHEIIQKKLSSMLQNDWIDVETYLSTQNLKFKYTCTKGKYETKISIDYPPINFACDGIIRIDNTYYLLEIKTCEYNSFKTLSEPKAHHMDQIKCYSTLLNLPNVLFLYEERQNGNIKVYEKHISEEEHKEVLNKLYKIVELSAQNIAPERLASNDYMCTNCEYKLKCKEWG